MKIAMADNCGLKFCADLKEYWEKQGHEVKYERGASEFLAEWADIYYIDWADGNINYLFNIYTGRSSEHSEWQSYHRPKFVVRAIDIDIWSGGCRSQELVDFVDKWIAIAPHLEKQMRSEANFGDKLKTIRPGINVDKFTLKQKQTDGFQLGMSLGDLWWYKNHMGGLDIFTSLYQKDPRWRLHIRGQHESILRNYNEKMYEYYLESRGIKDVVTLYGWQENMNEWYENIDILLHPGMKEGFCYAIGETLAKGIPVLANNFYGSSDIWNTGHVFRYDTHEEAIETLQKLVNEPTYQESHIRSECRKIIEEQYNVKTMCKEIDEWIEIK